MKMSVLRRVVSLHRVVGLLRFSRHMMPGLVVVAYDTFIAPSLSLSRTAKRTAATPRHAITCSGH